MTDATRALLRMFRLLPLDVPAPGTVAAADLRTSLCDARVALAIAQGRPCDLDGYPLGEPPSDLRLFEVIA